MAPLGGKKRHLYLLIISPGKYELIEILQLTTWARFLEPFEQSLDCLHFGIPTTAMYLLWEKGEFPESIWKFPRIWKSWQSFHSSSGEDICAWMCLKIGVPKIDWFLATIWEPTNLRHPVVFCHDRALLAANPLWWKDDTPCTSRYVRTDRRGVSQWRSWK